MFKVEFRTTCKICSKPITKKRFRTYCSELCRTKRDTSKYKDQRTDWQRRKRDKEAMIPSPLKVQCLICKKYYVQVCSHVLQVHHLLARDYKITYGLDVKRGRIPTWYKNKKADITYNNGTIDNLKKGKKNWFKKGSKTAGRYERSQETLDKLSQMGKN